MKSQILGLLAIFCINAFAQDSGTPAAVPAQGEIKEKRAELKEKRQERNQAQAVVNGDKEKLMQDKAAGNASAVEADKQKLKQDRMVRNEKQKEVRKERHELHKEIREKREAKQK